MTTETPGSTAPWASLTTPEIDAVDCAKAPLGTTTSEQRNDDRDFPAAGRTQHTPSPGTQADALPVVLLQPYHYC